MAGRPAISIGIGTVFMVGAVSGFIIVPEHKPTVISGDVVIPGGGDVPGALPDRLVGWSRTLYDALHITTWALLIVGALLVTVGLISYARR